VLLEFCIVLGKHSHEHIGRLPDGARARGVLLGVHALVGEAECLVVRRRLDGDQNGAK
jgi:hypothetical protein